MRTFFWFLYFFGYLIGVWPQQRKGQKALAAGDWATADALAARYVPHWAGRLLRLAGVTVTVYGRENIPAGCPCVFVANHRSYYDIPLMLTQLDAPHALLSKIEVDKIPFVRGWMRLLHCVFVDRDDVRASMAAMNQATENVKKGYSITIFPEGTRYKGAEGGMGEFKGGAFRVATKAKAPVVPVAISNSRAIMEDNGGWMRPAHVTIRILPAIETEGMPKDQAKALPNQVAQLIAANLAAAAKDPVAVPTPAIPAKDAAAIPAAATQDPAAILAASPPAATEDSAAAPAPAAAAKAPAKDLAAIPADPKEA